MLSDKEFIMRVRKHEILYNNKPDIRDTKECIWRLIAKECDIESAELAVLRWKQLVDAYLKYLRTGIKFVNAKDMSFLQTHLICFDSEMDEFTDQELMQLKNMFESETTSETEPRKRNDESKKPVSINATTSADTPSTHLQDLSPLELIFIGYAKALQKMPTALRIETKRKISDIMDDAELKLHEQLQH